MPSQRSLLAAVLLLGSVRAFAGMPSPKNPNGLPCLDGPDYRGRMKGPWTPDRFDGDPVGIRYSPRWAIFYYAQCIDPGSPGALQLVAQLAVQSGTISKPGCNGGKAIHWDRNGMLQLCSDEADSYVTIQGRGAEAVWVVGYYQNGAPPPSGPPVGGGPVPSPRPSPSPRPGPAPAPAPAPGGRHWQVGEKFVKFKPLDSNDYFVGDDNKAHCPAPDPSHPYRELMLGFDFERIERDSHTPKYAFAKLAQDLPPIDSCMRVIADKLGPEMGCLDPEDNYMLDRTNDGYIGWRTWSPGYAHWQWFGYNEAHPDPGAAGPAGKSPNCGRYTGPIVWQR